MFAFIDREKTLLEREWKMRLFLPLHQDDDVGNTRRRASGECLCYVCGVAYRNHPYFDEFTSCGEPIDHRLCDGSVVHL